MRPILPLLCVCALAVGSVNRLETVVSSAASREPASRDASPVIIKLDRAAGRNGHFEVQGLTVEQLDWAAQHSADNGWPRLFSVTVEPDRDDKQNERPAMLGTYAVTENRLRFEPRFPLQPATTYRAVLQIPGIAEAGGDSATLSQSFRIPAQPAGEPTRVAEVYPTRRVVPENLLKLYLHFSAPMSLGDSYRYLYLLDAEGEEVELPFLELGEELWNEKGTRLTVFFDPGRIKRGLKPREDVGPILEEEKTFLLVVDAAWPDAAGRPLKQSYRRTIEVGPPDDRQPDPKRWALRSPAGGTADPLVLRFDEPLDHAMLGRVLTVCRSDGTRLTGRIEIDREETRWRFRPDASWEPGNYEIIVETTLEDLAGNSIGRPFEVDGFRTAERETAPEQVAIPFAVRCNAK